MPLTRRSFLAAAPIAAHSATTFARTAQPDDATPPPGIAPYETRTVDGRTVGYRVAGEGDPLVMIMGFGGTMDDWDPTLLDALARTRQVITVDNRGLGASVDGAEASYSFATLADDIVAFVDALDLDTVDVFGWSMGAMIALDLTARHPDRVSHAVLHAGDMGGPDAVSASPDVLGMLFDVGGTPEEQLERQYRLFFPEAWIVENRAYLDEIFLRPKLPVTLDGVRRQGEALLTGWYQTGTALDAVTRPAMVLHGQDDIVIPFANALQLGRGIAGSWLIALPGGHGLQHQLPGACASIVDQFLTAP